MDGELLKVKLLDWGFVLAEIANSMGITPQDLHSKLKMKDLKVSFVIGIAAAINKTVYELIGEPAPPTVVKTELATTNKPVHHAIKGNDSLIKMPVLDMQFAAGVSAYTPDNMDAVDYVTVPKAWLKRGKTFACGRIRGDSMSPTLLDSGYGIIRMLERQEWGNMPNEEIYVVVTKDGQLANVQVKRVKNRLDRGFIVMTSDNPDKASHPNFNIYQDEIISIWHMDWYFTSRMPNIHNQYYSRLQQLEDKVEDLLNDLKPVIRKNK